MAEATTQKKDRANLTAIAYGKIKEAIMRNKLRPGYTISGCQIAKQLNMSRTPIREAIQILAQEDLVEIQKGVGFCVKSITLDELREISEVRTALECTALRTSIHTVPTSSIEELIRRWGTVYNHYVSGDKSALNGILELDSETHHMITHNGNNRYLISLIDHITLRVTRIQALTVGDDNALETIEQHVHILDAIRRKDLDEAESLLYKHILYSLSYVTKQSTRSIKNELNETNYLDRVFMD